MSKVIKLNDQEVPNAVHEAMQTVRNWAGGVFNAVKEIRGVEVKITNKGIGLDIIRDGDEAAEKLQQLMAAKETADQELEAAVNALKAAKDELDALPKNTKKEVREPLAAAVTAADEQLTSAATEQAAAAKALEAFEEGEG